MKKRLRVVSTICLLSGLTLLFVASYFELLLPAGKAVALLDFIRVVLGMIKGIGIALITTTFVNGLKYYFETTENLLKDGYINILTKEEIKEIKSKIEDKLYFQDIEHSGDNFYSFFEKELSSLLHKSYYKKYEARILCTINGDHIKKTIIKTIEMINPLNEASVETVPFEAYLQRVQDFSISDLYKITNFKVNQEDQTKEINKKLRIYDISKKCEDKYCVKVEAAQEIKIEKSSTIDMTIEIIAPINDVYFTNYITKPCKEYNISLTINSESHEVTGYGFGYMETQKDKLISRKLGNGLELGYRDWILPGDGVIFAINKIK